MTAVPLLHFYLDCSTAVCMQCLSFFPSHGGNRGKYVSRRPLAKRMAKWWSPTVTCSVHCVVLLDTCATCQNAPSSTLADWHMTAGVAGSPAHLTEVSPLERPISERSYALSIAPAQRQVEVEGVVSHRGEAPLSGRMHTDLSAAVDRGHPVSSMPPPNTGLKPLLATLVPPKTHPDSPLHLLS